MGKVIVITSGKGGVGKTTATANLGAALAAQDKKVALVDTDIGLRNLDVVLGLENRIVYDLVDVVEGTCRLKQALIRDKRYNSLYVLPAAQTRDKTAVTPKQMKEVIKELKKAFDYVLVDCPAGIEQGFKNAISGAEHAVVVAVPEVSSIRDADRIIGLLAANGIDEPELLINRIKMDMVKRGDMLTVSDATDILGIDLVGIIPEDEAIVVSSNRGEPVIEYSKSLAATAYLNTARRLVGEQVPFMEWDTGFFSKIKGLFDLDRNKKARG